MTLPTLMTKIQRLVIKQQLKKSVSTISQAFKQVSYNTDRLYSCYYQKAYGAVGLGLNMDECEQFWSEMTKVLKVSHVCDDNALAKGCIPKYKKGLEDIKKENKPDSTEEDIDNATYGCNGWRKNKIYKNTRTIVLLDGTIIGIYTYYKGEHPLFYVDVNGRKGPNRWGYDAFEIDILSDGMNLHLGRGNICGLVEKGGKTYKQMLQ